MKKPYQLKSANISALIKNLKTFYDKEGMHLKPKEERRCMHCEKIIQKGVKYEGVYDHYAELGGSVLVGDVHTKCKDKMPVDSEEEREYDRLKEWEMIMDEIDTVIPKCDDIDE